MKCKALIAVFLTGLGLACAFAGGNRDSAAPAAPAPDQQSELRNLRRQVGSLTAERDTLLSTVRQLGKTPITREIILQIDDNSIFSEMDYFISIPLVLVRGSLSEEVALQDGILTFTETTTSTRNSIAPDDAGRLQALSRGGGVQGPGADIDAVTFEISFLAEGIVLGFVRNRDRNRQDLDYVRVGSRTIPLNFNGARPHLLIRYRAEFLGDMHLQVIAPEGHSSDPVTAWTVPAAEGAADQNGGGGNGGFGNGGGGFSQVPEAPAPAADYPGPLASPPPPPAASAPAAPSQGASPGSSGAASSRAASSESASSRTAPDGFPAPPPGEAETAQASRTSGDVGDNDEERLAELLRHSEPAPAGRASGETRPAPVPEDPGPTLSLFNTGGGEWIVQVGAFEESGNAENAWTTLQNAGFMPDRDSFQGLTRVFIRGVPEHELETIALIVELLGFGEPYIRK